MMCITVVAGTGIVDEKPYSKPGSDEFSCSTMYTAVALHCCLQEATVVRYDAYRPASIQNPFPLTPSPYPFIA